MSVREKPFVTEVNGTAIVVRPALIFVPYSSTAWVVGLATAPGRPASARAGDRLSGPARRHVGVGEVVRRGQCG